MEGNCRGQSVNSTFVCVKYEILEKPLTYMNSPKHVLGFKHASSNKMDEIFKLHFCKNRLGQIDPPIVPHFSSRSITKAKKNFALRK